MISTSIIIGLSVGAFVLVVTSLILIWFCKRKSVWPFTRNLSESLSSAQPKNKAVTRISQNSDSNSLCNDQDKFKAPNHEEKDTESFKQIYKKDPNFETTEQIDNQESSLKSSLKKKKAEDENHKNKLNYICEDKTSSINFNEKSYNFQTIDEKPSPLEHTNISDTASLKEPSLSIERNISGFEKGFSSSNPSNSVKKSLGHDNTSGLRSKPSDTSDYVSDLESRNPSRAGTFSQHENYHIDHKSGKLSQSLSDVTEYLQYNYHFIKAPSYEEDAGQEDEAQDVNSQNENNDDCRSKPLQKNYSNRRTRSSEDSSGFSTNVTAESAKKRLQRNKSITEESLSASNNQQASRTIIELPIYSQATWSGPGGIKKKRRGNKKLHWKENRWDLESNLKINHNTNKSNIKTSNCQGMPTNGPYLCAHYKSLPIDMSHLPKELIAKIGGQPDRLLEPIDQLDFAHLCRPLPDRATAKESSKRMVVEALHLPPGHSDIEVLSGTYEDQDTGIVSTDL